MDGESREDRLIWTRHARRERRRRRLSRLRYALMIALGLLWMLAVALVIAALITFSILGLFRRTITAQAADRTLITLCAIAVVGALYLGMTSVLEERRTRRRRQEKDRGD